MDAPSSVQQQEPQQFLPVQTNVGMHPELTKYLVNPQDIIIELQHDLRGEMWNNDRSVWIKVGDALCNDVGINAIISLCKTIINRNAFLSNIAEQDVHNICLDLANVLTKMIFTNYDLWGIEPEKGYAYMIVEKVDTYMYLGLMRALKGNTSNLIKNIESTVRTISEQPQKKRFGLF